MSEAIDKFTRADTDSPDLDLTLQIFNCLKSQGMLLESLTRNVEIVAEKIASLENAALRAPLYVKDGVFAIHRTGGWGGFVIPTTHLGVLAGYTHQGAANCEAGVQSILNEHTPPDAIAVDIGAHIGIHAVMMGQKIRDQGQLVVFEPDPELVEALRLTLRLNRLSHCAELVDAAVTDREGTSSLNRTLHSPENSVFPAMGDMPARDIIEVRTISLDGYFQPGARIGIIKIDAEGAETMIFRGMRRVMNENPDLKIVMEFAPGHFRRAGESPTAFLDMLTDFAFRVQVIEEPGGNLVEIDHEALIERTTANLFSSRLSEPARS